MSRVPPVDMDRLNQLYTKNLLPMYSEPSSASLLVENRSMSPSVSMGVFSLESSPDRTIEENSLRRVSTLSTSQPRQTVPLIHSYSHSVLKPNDNGSKYKNWTAKSGSLIADLLMTAGADHIITMDLHDPQFIGFFDIPVENLSSQPLMIKYIKDSIPEFRKAIIVSPDAGGAKRASIIADKLNMDFALVHKERRFNKSDTSSAALFGSDIQMMLVGDVKNRVCILIDDIADTSFTICRASKLLKESGAIKVYALITHAIMSGNAIERLKKSSIDEIIVSNTVPQTLNISKSNGMVKVFDVAPLFAEAIRRIHNGESVSFLLDVVAI